MFGLKQTDKKKIFITTFINIHNY